MHKMPKNISELFEMFIDFQKLVLRFLVSQTIFVHPLNPPPETYLVWQISKNQCLWRSQLEKLLRKKNHGEKSVQKLEKSVTLPSGSRFYKIFWSTFWSSLRIIWEFLILQDIVGIVPIGKSLKSFFHFWGPKKLLTGHHGKVYKIKMQTRFSYGFPNQIIKSLFKK